MQEKDARQVLCQLSYGESIRRCILRRRQWNQVRYKWLRVPDRLRRVVSAVLA